MMSPVRSMTTEYSTGLRVESVSDHLKAFSRDVKNGEKGTIIRLKSSRDGFRVRWDRGGVSIFYTNTPPHKPRNRHRPRNRPDRLRILPIIETLAAL